MSQLPQFSINLSSFVKDLDALLSKNLAKIEQLIQQRLFDWSNLILPLDDLDNKLEQFWSPLSHLHSVSNSKALRECYQACLPKLSAYESSIGQNTQLYQAIKAIDQSSLDSIQQKIINDMLLGFELAGVALSAEKKQRFEQIQTELSDLSNQFENNVLDATDAFNLTITDESRLRGLPEHVLHTARELAEQKKQIGWTLSLEFPCYLGVVTYADDRALRETFYHAFVTRASEQGPSANKFDNTQIVNTILKRRDEKSKLLNFTDYAALSISTKMADSSEQVIDFLEDLSKRSHQQAVDEFKNLQRFASEQGVDKLEPWDVAYFSEKLRIRDFDVSQEELRVYFPQTKVLTGLFTVIQRLYGIRLELVPTADVWHADVLCYRLLDNQNTVRGYIYLDLYARAQKRGGAWMDSLQSRLKHDDGTIQLPIATLTCNFAKPVSGQEAFFSHDEIITLFHEFGHCLHHLLTKVDYLSASGINGVEWDAVELPSQIFENWCWEYEVLQLLSSHAKTGESLPIELYKKLLATKNFQSAMAMMRQLEFSLFDFYLHMQAYSSMDFMQLLHTIRQKTSVTPSAEYNRFPHSFTHIFSGGYGAGYYSYKWAEVLSSDAYSRFEEEGIFNEETGQDFLKNILEVGSSVSAADAFEAFRGRPAKIDALLRHNGINEQ